LTESQISNYRNFIDNYDNIDLLTQYYPELIGDINSYKALVKEGTRQKTNRFERHKYLKRVMNKQ
jgi:hypothetical protein